MLVWKKTRWKASLQETEAKEDSKSRDCINDESVFALVSQFHSNGPVHESTSVELNCSCKMIFALADTKAYALWKTLLILEDTYKK